MVVKIGDPTHGGDLSVVPDVLPFPKQLPDAAKGEVSVLMVHMCVHAACIMVGNLNVTRFGLC
jgi:hypothetical protein